MLAGKTICLVGSGHIATDPRLVKEADALTAAGAEVRVVATEILSRLKPHDHRLATASSWRYEPVDLTRERSRLAYGRRAVRQKAYAALPKALWRRPGVAERALGRTTAPLAAAAPPAQLYIAHNLAALPAAAQAAARCDARLGFDAEDYHCGELDETPANARVRAFTRLIEDRYMPRCDYVTAASPMIAAAYQERLRKPVLPILNVFPLESRPARVATGPRLDQEGPVRLYWFSQTLGPGRGLEWVVAALGRMQARATLHLRGHHPHSDYAHSLRRLAERHGVAERLELLPVEPPDRMVSLAADHDIGLAVEPKTRLNHRLCLSNKTFTYLAAGMPVVLSDTPAQAALAAELGAAATLVPDSDVTALADALDVLAGDADRLSAAKRHAWGLATDRFNWEREQLGFLREVEKVLDRA